MMASARQMACYPGLVLLLTSCAYQPGKYDKSMPLPTWVEAQKAGSQQLPYNDTWWRAFGFPQLEQLMAELSANSLDLATARARAEQAAAQLDIANSENWPLNHVRVNQRGSRDFDDHVTSNRTGSTLSSSRP